jgi:hypothetical protein
VTEVVPRQPSRLRLRPEFAAVDAAASKPLVRDALPGGAATAPADVQPGEALLRGSWGKCGGRFKMGTPLLLALASGQSLVRSTSHANRNC